MGIRDAFSRSDTDNVIDLALARAQPAAANVDRAIVASAEPVRLRTEADILMEQRKPYTQWQRSAWRYTDNIPEIKYAYNLMGSIMSRIRLYPAINVDPDAPPASTTQLLRRGNSQNEEERARDTKDRLSPPEGVTDEVMKFMEELVEELGNGPGGVAGLMRMFTLNTSIAGECYLVRDASKKWSIRSTQELVLDANSKRYWIRDTRNRTMGDIGVEWVDPEATGQYVGRIWRNHPQYSREPDSSMLALIDLCDELLVLQRLIRSVARSQMNAGILKLGENITVASRSVTQTTEEAENEGDALLNELYNVLTTPVLEDGSAAAVVPVVVQGPDDSKIEHIKVSRDSDRFLIERADKTLERILYGIDVPKDLVTGYEAVRYNNASISNEGMYKSHIEPLAVMLVDALTTIYFQVAIRQRFPDLNDSVVKKLVIWYDPTEVVIKPDPAEAATTGYEAKLVSGAAWRRAHGFSDTDAPSDEEVMRRVVVDSLGALPQDVASVILHKVFPDLFPEGLIPKQSEGPDGETPDNPPQPGRKTAKPVKPIPDQNVPQE